MATSNIRQQLIASLKDQEYHIPDLQSLFSQWPRGVSPDVEKLRSLVPDKLLSLTSSSKKLAKLSRVDFALFSASWWPHVGFEQAQTLTWLSLWLFIWDDEIDAEAGHLGRDLQKAQDFRADTIRYLRACLGLAEENEKISDIVSLSPIISFFKIIGDEAKRVYTQRQREVLMKELKFFMEASELEQRRRLSPSLPSLEEYISCRMGTSAVGVTLAFHEYAQNVELPSQILDNPLMRVLWDESNVNIWTVNDLLSLKKEMDDETLDSLLPILYQKHGDIQHAVLEAVNMIETSIERFDCAANQLLEQTVEEDEKQALMEYIEMCRFNCTGNLHWSLLTGRYGIHCNEMNEGVTIKL